MTTQADNAATKDGFAQEPPGYITSTHHITDTPGVLNPTTEPAPEQVPPQETQPPAPPAPEPPEVEEQVFPPEFEKLDAYFQKRFGAGLDDVFGMLNDLGDFRNQQLIQQQENTLRDEWGGDYETRMEIVKKKFAELPDAHKPAYDTVEGARRLYAEYALQSGEMPGRNSYTRPVRPVRTPPNNQKAYDYTQQQIKDLALTNPKEYDRLQADITRAYQMGRVRY